MKGRKNIHNLPTKNKKKPKQNKTKQNKIITNNNK